PRASRDPDARTVVEEFLLQHGDRPVRAPRDRLAADPVGAVVLVARARSSAFLAPAPGLQPPARRARAAGRPRSGDADPQRAGGTRGRAPGRRRAAAWRFAVGRERAAAAADDSAQRAVARRSNPPRGLKLAGRSPRRVDAGAGSRAALDAHQGRALVRMSKSKMYGIDDRAA